MAPLPTDWEIAEGVFRGFPDGEDQFWFAWELGTLEPRIQEWFRSHAESVGLEEEVRNADSRAERRERFDHVFTTGDGHREKCLALEVLTVLVESPGRVTTTAASGDPVEYADLRRQFTEVLFEMLEEELDIDVSASGGESQAVLGTRMVQCLFAELAPTAPIKSERPPPPSFLDLVTWLNEFRDRLGSMVPASKLDSSLLTIAGRLLERSADGRGYRWEPSFRLFLRQRLLNFCRERGWKPRLGRRFDNLEAAFSALTREKIGQALDSVREKWSWLDQWLQIDAVVA